MAKFDIKAVITAEDNASGVFKSFAGRASDQFKDLGANVAKYGAVLTGAGVAAAGFAIKSASEMQMLRSNFDVLTGSAEKGAEVFQKLNKMGASTPFETKDLANATKTMLSFGISSDDALKNLKMLGDVSMGNKEKLSGLSLAFSQVQSTGRLMGQDLLQMINQGFNPLTIISQQTGKSMATLKDEMAKGAISADMVTSAFQKATSEGGLFFNGMEKGSMTFEGRMSTLKDNVGMVARSIIGLSETGDVVKGGLFDKVSMAVVQLTDWLNKNKDAIVQVATVLVNMLGTAIMFVVNLLVTIARYLNEHRDIALALAIAVGVVLTAAFTAWAISVIAATWPILAIIAAIAALSYGVIKLIENWDRIKGSFRDGGWMDKMIDKFWIFTGPLGAVVKLVKEIIQNWDKIKSFTSGIGGKISGLFGGGRASGGPVSGGTSYLVGEQGPEIFTPGGSGMITPNKNISNQVSINMYGNINNTSNASLADIGQRLSREIELALQGA